MIGPLAWHSSMLSSKKIYGSEERWRSGVMLSDSQLEYTVRNNKQPQIHPRTRAQVAMAFNISIGQQLAYESSIPLRVGNLGRGEIVCSDGPSGDGDHYYTVAALSEDLDL
jgi:hypothetical protein